MRQAAMLLTMLCGTALAGNVTSSEAKKKALQFMPGKQFKQMKLQGNRSLSRSADGSEAFYIFNADGGGFVIVSGDDRTVAILGYSDKGNINIEKLPDNVRYWLNGYAEQISGLGENYHVSARSLTRAKGQAIKPLIQTQWDQGYPYNLMCPEYQGFKCLTGCVPTAISQLMYYYKWPQGEVKAVSGYKTYSLGIELPDLPSTSFKWSKMKPTYYGTEDEESKMAVAELMRYVGQGSGPGCAGTDYGLGGTSSGTYGQLITYFGYSAGHENLNRQRSNMSQQMWDEVMFGELSNKRPILYIGFPIEGCGHAFIVDGFDGNGLFHINWGWGGLYDGHFVLSVADPYSRKKLGKWIF